MIVHCTSLKEKNREKDVKYLVLGEKHFMVNKYANYIDDDSVHRL